MRNYVLLVLLSALLWSCSTTPPKEEVKLEPNWRGILVLNDSSKLYLPFNFELDLNDSLPKMLLINGNEGIELDRIEIKGDSIRIIMDPFESELRLVREGVELKGGWHNLAKGLDYVIPVIARNGTSMRFLQSDYADFQISGNYAIQFGDTATGFPGLGEFVQKDNRLLGTIRTETGDYRFLEGILSGDDIYLSCFDGAHAFLFTAKFNENYTISDGNFYSGNHYHTTWEGVLDETFRLRDPDSLTMSLTEASEFDFKIPLGSGDTLSMLDQRFENKVSIIQIMGTWCPNCKDETEFLKELYSEYGADNLEILAVGFEHTKDPVKGAQRLEAYKAIMNIEYDLVYGGPSRKELVTEVFPTLDRVISFPTLLVVDRAGNLVKIHTGFNGPATSRYEQFTKEMRVLLDSLTS